MRTAKSFRCETKDCVVRERSATFSDAGSCPVCGAPLVDINAVAALPTQLAPRSKLTPEQKRLLASIRKLISAPDEATVDQGIALLAGLNDPAIALELADGLTVEPMEQRLRPEYVAVLREQRVDKGLELIVSQKSEVHRTVKPEHRSAVAMTVARVAGLFDGAKHLNADVVGWTSSGLDVMPRSRSRISLVPFAGLKDLEVLTIAKDVHLRGEPEDPAVRLAELGPMPALREIRIERCTLDLAGIGILACLRRLSLDGCASDYAAIAECVGLEELTIRRFGKGGEIEFVRPLRSLRSLTLTGFAVDSLEPLRSLDSLSKMELNHIAVGSVEPLASLRNLEILILGWLPNLTSVEPLRGVSGLRELSLWHCYAWAGAGLEGLRGLEKLRIVSCGAVADLGNLSSLPKLAEVDVRNLPLLSSLESLRGCRALKTLSVKSSGPIKACDGLEDCEALESASFGCDALVDVHALTSLRGLQRLDLLECSSFADTKALAKCRGLNHLDLGKTSVSDVGPLAALTSLTFLNLGNTAVKTFRSLSTLTALKSLTLPSRRFRGQEAELLEAVPGCAIQ